MPISKRHQALPLLLLPLLVCACGHRDTATADVSTPEPVVSQRITRDGDRMAVAPAERPAVSPEVSTLPVPLPIVGETRNPDYWSLTAASIDEAGGVSSSSSATAAATAPPSRPVGGGGSSPRRAGALLAPVTVYAGRIQSDSTASLWLVALPIAFQAEPGFAKPLSRIDVTLTLGEHGGWSLIAIPSIGFKGLRHGPLPLPLGPIQYYFRSDELFSTLEQAGASHQASWSFSSREQQALATRTTCFAVVMAPAGTHEIATAVVHSVLRFSPGPEATVVVGDAHLNIALAAPPRPLPNGPLGTL
jgi:hypothetical protein